MTINSLVIEVTRRCNLKCAHCIRGDAQNVDLDIAKFKTLMEVNEVDYIGSIVFSGGEPLLRYNLIGNILKYCKDEDIGIGYFYIATNGFYSNKDVLDVLLDLYVYCSEPDLCSVQISSSEWHKSPPDLSTKRLQALSFVDKRNRLSFDGLIGQGNAVDILGVDESVVYSGEIYLNAKGEVLSCCDYSYSNQDKNSLGSVEIPLIKLFKDVEYMEDYFSYED